jgi:hypothetical protein
MAEEALTPSQGPQGPLSPMEEVSAIIERRTQSEAANSDLWKELTEVYRGIKCRVEKKMKPDPANKDKEIEDTTSTNVAMPDLNIMHRKNVARFAAQPYRLRYIGGTQPYLAESLSALSAQQYDRSRESFHDRRVVMHAEAAGFGYSKLYFDELGFDLKLRRAIVKDGKVAFRDRRSIMQSMGAPDDEINGAIKERGPQIDDSEAEDFMGKTGNDVTITEKVKRYEGPCVKSVFPGDLALQPGCLSLYDSDFAIESYQETDLWLKKQLKLTYTDPRTGREMKVFDPAAVKGLMDLDPDPDISRATLKNMFEDAIGRQTRPLNKNIRVRKRFDILEEHAMDEDGIMWIKWVSFQYRDMPLGKMPYPWDFYGAYAYTELVPLPDMISCYGDATPRLLRFLYLMHNRIVAQNYDYVTNLLKKFLLIKTGKEPKEPVDRGWFKQIVMDDISESAIRYLQEPGLPPGALDREAQVMRMMGIAEPSLNNVDTGSEANPMAGKTATTAIIQSKAADALTVFKIAGRDLYLRELGQKKLWMNQQEQDEPWQIDPQFWNQGLREQVDQKQIPQHALSERNGKTVGITLDPMEIQEDFQVEPEAGSYLAVDDELRQEAAMNLEQVAVNAPDVIDRRKVIRFHLSTIRGIGNPDDYLLPEAPPDPMAGIKVNLNISVPVKFEDLPAPAKTAVLEKFGADPSVVAASAAEFQHEDTLKGVNKISEAAESAAAMQEPADIDQKAADQAHAHASAQVTAATKQASRASQASQAKTAKPKARK